MPGQPPIGDVENLLALLNAVQDSFMANPQSAKLVATLVKDTMATLQSLLAVAHQGSPFGMPARLPTSATSLDSPTVEPSDFEQKCHACLRRVAALLKLAVSNRDDKFAPNQAASIIVAALAALAKDTHFVVNIRTLAVTILLDHIGWGEAGLVGLTQDRIEAYTALAALAKDNESAPYWPWNAEPVEETT